jgi:holo-[acyl-carrier protein] synthase
MKTLGIGVDIVQNSRIRKSITKEKFLLRIFTNDEINKSKKQKIKLLFFLKGLQLKKHSLKH